MWLSAVPDGWQSAMWGLMASGLSFYNGVAAGAVAAPAMPRVGARPFVASTPRPSFYPRSEYTTNRPTPQGEQPALGGQPTLCSAPGHRFFVPSVQFVAGLPSSSPSSHSWQNPHCPTPSRRHRQAHKPSAERMLAATPQIRGVWGQLAASVAWRSPPAAVYRPDRWLTHVRRHR
jgi:hypothetical protein